MENLEPKYDERKGCGCTLAFLSITAIIISVLALALVEPRTLKINEWGDIDSGFDYLGFIIGILALMMTLMVGWNIWQTIASREEIKEARETSEKIKILDTELRVQRNLLENRNLEIIHLIDAHARLHEAENESDLSNKYILYAEAIMLLIQSKIDMSYEQFDNARAGLLDTLNAFQILTDIDEIEDFINNERAYEKYYQLLMSLLTKRNEEIDKLRRQLTSQREFRTSVIADMRNSDIGKRIKRRASKREKRNRELEKNLRKKYADTSIKTPDSPTSE